MNNLCIFVEKEAAVMKALKAMYDGQKVLFEQETNIPKDSKLIVILLSDDEDADWYSFSAKNLNRAYGEDEPDYSDALIKESNPLYEGR